MTAKASIKITFTEFETTLLRNVGRLIEELEEYVEKDDVMESNDASFSITQLRIAEELCTSLSKKNNCVIYKYGFSEEEGEEE